ncbi:MAG: hypothetical protein M3R36_11215 [Bacteroidota bacterium]|nr:hypothetical protein [Bacteroidota bacterium]
MAKKIQTKTKPPVKSTAIDIDVAVDKYFWLVIPVFAIIYYISSKYSTGFYQDDEIGQYINMIQFWTDPFAILGNSPKPGYKIFMVVPSMFGYETVLAFNSIIASLTVYFTYILLKVYKIKYAFFGALMLSVQPLFFDLSFRSYAEIFTSLLLLFVLTLYKKENYFWAGLLCGYIFTVRQEIALLIIIFTFLFYKKKNYSAIIALAVFPVIYDLLGFLKTGDILFVLTEMKSIADYSYKSRGISHYFIVYIFIVGPVTLLLFLCGFFGFLSDTNKFKQYVNQYAIFYIVFISIFAVQLLTMFKDGANPGNWRYLLHISPIAAVFATIGLNNLSRQEFRKISYILIGILAFITLVFFSKTTDGFILLDVSDYTKFIIIVISLVLIALIKKEPSKDYLNKISTALLLLAIINLFISFNPKKLSPENIALKETSEFINTLNINGKEIYYNHTFVPFYNDKYYRESPQNFKRLISENLKEVKPGALLIWDSHYSYRPKDMGNDIQLERLKNDSAYKLLKNINSSDGRFGSFIFEKIN